MNRKDDTAAAAARRWHRRVRHSLGLRLVLLFLLLALALAGIFLAGMQRALAAGWSGLVRPLVVDYVDRLAAEIGSPPDAARARELTRRLPVAVRIEGPVVRFDSHPQRREPWRGHDDGPADAERLLSRQSADGHRISFGLGEAGWSARPRAIGWVTLAALLALTGLAYGVVRHLFRPLDDIRAGALRFGRGDFAQPIPQRRHDELGDLAAQINTMARELQAMLEARRALLLAVSHELRSPLTRARLNAELVAPGESRDALLRDLGAMRDLIAELLEAERLADGGGTLQRESTDLNALVEELVAEQFADAKLQLELAPALPRAVVDPARLRLLLRNLLDNALRHSRGVEPPPRLACEMVDGALRLSVRDFGPGVDEVLLPRLGEAFYRPDTARSRGTGGSGLGLYLCRLVARSHGGSLAIRNARPGLEVTVTLPMNR